MKYSVENTYDESDVSLYTIVLKPGMDRNEAIQFIVDTVKEVLLFVKENS